VDQSGSSHGLVNAQISELVAVLTAGVKDGGAEAAVVGVGHPRLPGNKLGDIPELPEHYGPAALFLHKAMKTLLTDEVGGEVLAACNHADGGEAVAEPLGELMGQFSAAANRVVVMLTDADQELTPRQQAAVDDCVAKGVKVVILGFGKADGILRARGAATARCSSVEVAASEGIALLAKSIAAKPDEAPTSPETRRFLDVVARSPDAVASLAAALRAAPGTQLGILVDQSGSSSGGVNTQISELAAVLAAGVREGEAEAAVVGVGSPSLPGNKLYDLPKLEEHQGPAALFLHKAMKTPLTDDVGGQVLAACNVANGGEAVVEPLDELMNQFSPAANRVVVMLTDASVELTPRQQAAVDDCLANGVKLVILGFGTADGILRARGALTTKCGASSEGIALIAEGIAAKPPEAPNPSEVFASRVEALLRGGADGSAVRRALVALPDSEKSEAAVHLLERNSPAAFIAAMGGDEPDVRLSLPEYQRGLRGLIRANNRTPDAQRAMDIAFQALAEADRPKALEHLLQNNQPTAFIAACQWAQAHGGRPSIRYEKFVDGFNAFVGAGTFTGTDERATLWAFSCLSSSDQSKALRLFADRSSSAYQLMIEWACDPENGAQPRLSPEDFMVVTQNLGERCAKASFHALEVEDRAPVLENLVDQGQLAIAGELIRWAFDHGGRPAMSVEQFKTLVETRTDATYTRGPPPWLTDFFLCVPPDERSEALEAVKEMKRDALHENLISWQTALPRGAPLVSRSDGTLQSEQEAVARAVNTPRIGDNLDHILLELTQGREIAVRENPLRTVVKLEPASRFGAESAELVRDFPGSKYRDPKITLTLDYGKVVGPDGKQGSAKRDIRFAPSRNVESVTSIRVE
jgi:hypothetical protein